ncbi:MAG: TIGR01841 family phasin [Sphingopyxis sp.]|nr:TIGR01841 family phasin [Sphingopyxis sp.]
MGKGKSKQPSKAAPKAPAQAVAAPAKPVPAAKPSLPPVQVAAAPAVPAAKPVPAPAIGEQFIKGTFAMTDQFKAFFDVKSFDKYFGDAKSQVEKASAQTLKAYEDAAKFNKENLDAFVVASTTYAKGVESVSKSWAAFAQETFEASANVAKAMLGAKTLKEAVDLQTDFAKTTFDKFVAEGTKVSEASIKVTNEALEPINARVNVAVEKMLKPALAA